MHFAISADEVHVSKEDFHFKYSEPKPISS